MCVGLVLVSAVWVGALVVSCVPNCILVPTLSGECELRTLRDVACGEEITISYVDRAEFPTVSDRRRHLLQRYVSRLCYTCEGQWLDAQRSQEWLVVTPCGRVGGYRGR